MRLDYWLYDIDGGLKIVSRIKYQKCFSGLTNDNRKYRETIRHTWGASARAHGGRVEFGVGLPHPNILPHLQNADTKLEFERIVDEHKQYGDILQANVVDNSLVHKLVHCTYFQTLKN